MPAAPDTATNLVPSAEEATEVQYQLGALVWVQLAPEFVEVQIQLLKPAATNLVPSADEATEDRKLWGALVNVQVAPASFEM